MVFFRYIDLRHFEHILEKSYEVGLSVLTCTTISDIRFYSFNETAGKVIDSSFELVNILPGKFPKTRDSIQKIQKISSQV